MVIPTSPALETSNTGTVKVRARTHTTAIVLLMFDIPQHTCYADATTSSTPECFFFLPIFYQELHAYAKY